MQMASIQRIIAVLMDRDEEDAWILIEGILRPVAVVDVIVNDRNSLQPVRLLQVFGRDDDVVEQTESHPLIRLRVVSRWTDQSVRIVDFALHHLRESADKAQAKSV